MIEVEYRREADLPVRRLEDGAALVEHELGDEVLGEDLLLAVADRVEAPGIAGIPGCDRHREAPRLGDAVADQAEAEEPVLAEGRAVALQPVVAVVGIEQVFAVAEQAHDAPAVRQLRELVERVRVGVGQPRGIAGRRFVAQHGNGRAAAIRLCRHLRRAAVIKGCVPFILSGCAAGHEKRGEDGCATCLHRRPPRSSR